MSVGGEAGGARAPGDEAFRKLRALVEALAFFAASRNYGYVDILGNALDPAVALETVYNVVRDFKSACVDSRYKPCEGAEEGEVDARCPEVKPEWLDAAVRAFTELTAKYYGEGKTSDLIVLYRRLAAEAMGRSLSLMVTCGGSGSQESRGASSFPAGSPQG